MIETGVYFDDIHSFHDLNLILSSVDISPAKPKLNLLDIPGGDGSLDFTEVHGEVKFKDRDCSFVFTVNPAEAMTFEEKKTQVSNILNGTRRKITLDKDSGYYYDARITVDDYLQDRNLKQITVTATAKPYKLKQNETVVAVNLTSDEQDVILTNGRKSAIPIITCTDDGATIIYDGYTIKPSAGTHKYLDVCLKEGNNPFKVSGVGIITFTYQEGEL
jgi:hypothetical protein